MSWSGSSSLAQGGRGTVDKAPDNQEDGHDRHGENHANGPENRAGTDHADEHCKWAQFSAPAENLRGEIKAFESLNGDPNTKSGQQVAERSISEVRGGQGNDQAERAADNWNKIEQAAQGAEQVPGWNLSYPEAHCIKRDQNRGNLQFALDPITEGGEDIAN